MEIPRMYIWQKTLEVNLFLIYTVYLLNKKACMNVLFDE